MGWEPDNRDGMETAGREGLDTAVKATSRSTGMGDEWAAEILRNLISVRHGFAFEGKYFHDDPVGDILLTPGNFAVGGGFKEDKLKYYDGPVPDDFVLGEGDLLVTMTDLSKQSDTLGYPAFVPATRTEHRFLHNQRLGRVASKAPDLLDPRFLYYLLCTEEYRHEVLASATGTTVKHTSPDRIGRFEFFRPPLNEQRAIAHILGTLDDKIELNRCMNETLEAMARALFKSWFVDFDPVRAKMEGRWRRGESLSGLPAHLYDLFPDRLENSELGEIPEGWEVGPVGARLDNFDSKRVPVSGAERAKRQGPYPYHGAAGVMDYVDDYLFDGVYLLIGEDGSVVQESGLAVTQYVWGKFWVNNHAHVVQGLGSVSTEQLYLHYQFDTIAPYVTGAVQPKLSQGRMNTMPFLFAGDGICRTFSATVAPLFARLRTCSDECAVLEALRDTLLPKLISGQLRVKDIEQSIAKAV
jgi:type I restriction enzyme S subunit